LFALAGLAQAAVERAGGLALAVGQLPPAEALQHMARFRPNAIAAYPPYMAALTREAQRAGVRMPLSYILMGGELLTSGQTELFSSYWGAAVFNGYGLTEAALAPGVAPAATPSI